MKTPFVIAFVVLCVMVGATCMFHKPKVKLEDNKETDVIIKGSDSEFNLIVFFSNEYKRLNPAINFDIMGGGSSKGIKALLKNETHIANASRVIFDEELEEAKKNKLELTSYIIASDAVAIITHRSVGVDSLSLDQLKAIFCGKVKNWKEVGGIDMPIVIYGRDNNSGTHYYMLQRLLLQKFPTGTLAFEYNNQIIKHVEMQEGSIGYVNLGSITTVNGKPYDHVWTVSIYVEGGRACSPFDLQAVKYGDYPLTRPLYQYVNKRTDNKVLQFIKFELAPKQQLDLERHGYFPITPMYEAINKKNEAVL